MTSITESTGKRTTSMDAITERIPRVVVLRSYDSYFITEPLPIVTVRTIENHRRVQSRTPVNATTKKASSPLVLRLSVTALILVFLASMGGVAAARSHPKWFIGLERFIHQGPAPTTTRHAQLLGHAVLVSSTPTTAVYQVPSASYSIAISVVHPCWFVVKSLTGSTSVLAALTLSPAASPMSIPAHGSTSLTVAAQTRSVTIFEGTKVLVSIKTPQVGIIYMFISKA